MVASAESWSSTTNLTEVDDRNRGNATQMRLSLASVLLILCCLASFSLTWYLHFLHTTEALNESTLAFRKAKAETLNEQLASSLRPLWSIARQFVDRLRGGGQQDGYTVLPPSVDTFNALDQLQALERAVYPYLNWEAHLRSTTSDFSQVTHGMLVGLVIMLGVDANKQLATNLASCANMVFAGLALNSRTGTAQDYIVDRGFRNPEVADSYLRNIHVFDRANLKIGPTVFGADSPGGCGGMAPFWSNPQAAGFYNFSWFGPLNPGLGWGNHLEASVPIYNEQHEAVGRVGIALSMGASISALLRKLLSDSEASINAAAALYTEAGTVLGLTEDAASATEEQAATLGDLEESSHTYRAVQEIQRRFGSPCPSTWEFLRLDDRLVDVAPFFAEDYGLPPLPQRWCKVTTSPRSNIFHPVDRAARQAIFVGVTCVAGVLGGLALLGISLGLALEAEGRMRAESRASDRRLLKDAAESIRKLTAPMALVRAEDFLAVHELQCYEAWRDRGKVKHLDSIDAVNSFKAAGNCLVFISHQWLGWTRPDTHDRTQLKVMHAAVSEIVATMPGSQVYIWLDYMCIAQHHSICQARAVASLPVYVSLVDLFVICAPDAKHCDTQQEVGLRSYSRRGWCRAEMLAKACSSGLDNMFVCSGEGEMRHFSPQDMDRISLSVYEGDFTVGQDAERLVTPVLGLYSLILRQGHKEHMQSIRAHIEERKDRFFPHSYNIEKEQGCVERRKLFGGLVQLMEKEIAQFRHEPMASSRVGSG